MVTELDRIAVGTNLKCCKKKRRLVNNATFHSPQNPCKTNQEEAKNIAKKCI